MSFLNGPGFSLANGLSAAGGAVAAYAGTAGLEQQKADLDQKRIVLSESLRATNEQALQQGQQTFQSGENAKQIAATTANAALDRSAHSADVGTSAAATITSAQTAADAERAAAATAANKDPDIVKVSDWYATAGQPAKDAFMRQTLLEKGFPPQAIDAMLAHPITGGAGSPAAQSPSPANAVGGGAGASPSPATPVASATSSASGSGSAPAPAIPASPGAAGAAPPSSSSPLDGGTAGGVSGSATPDTGGATPAAGTSGALPPGQYNEDALKGVDSGTAGIVKAMVEGRMSPPNTSGGRTPSAYSLYTQTLANKYDPSFDATTWAGRVATRQAFSPDGAAGQAVGALNTALAHAGRLSDNLGKLNNAGGIFTPLNAPVNAGEKMFGDQRQTNVQMDVSALASEARKVYAASGGGNLTELEKWEENFPENGSPEQQQGALKEFAGLLGGRLNTLAGQYNAGMQRTADPVQLLSPAAAATYEKLSGDAPENATGYQTGQAPAAAPAAAPAKPAWANYEATGPKGQRIFSDGKAWFDASGNPLQ